MNNYTLLFRNHYWSYYSLELYNNKTMYISKSIKKSQKVFMEIQNWKIVKLYSPVYK